MTLSSFLKKIKKKFCFLSVVCGMMGIFFKKKRKIFCFFSCFNYIFFFVKIDCGKPTPTVLSFVDHNSQDSVYLACLLVIGPV